MLEESLLEDMHPFAARLATSPSPQKNSDLSPRNSPKRPFTPKADEITLEEKAIGAGQPKIQKEVETQQVSNIASNIAILQLNNEDIEDLKEPSYQPQTYRLSEREIEWIKDTAYRLSKEIRRGKVSQVDILRVAIKLFENLLATNKAELIEILEKIK